MSSKDKPVKKRRDGTPRQRATQGRDAGASSVRRRPALSRWGLPIIAEAHGKFLKPTRIGWLFF
jgi:hypothetical protein